MMNGKPVFNVNAKSVINFKSGFEPKLLCDGPTFTAGTCCAYSCTFCSVPTTMRKQFGAKGWLTQQGVTGRHPEIVVRRARAPELAREQLLAHSNDARRQHKVIYASPLVDVAANLELLRETAAICKEILELTNWDIRLLSKSNLLPKLAMFISENVGEQWARCRMIYGVSTGTLSDKLAAAFEKGCPLVSKRIESLHWLQDNGFRTFGMICPSLPLWQPGMTDAEAYETFAHEMASSIRADRCEHVWAEVINLRGENFTDTVNALDAAGYSAMANELRRVSHGRDEWEAYARQTFEAHASVYEPGKLRFLQYVTKKTRGWWDGQRERGAVVLGHEPHKQTKETKVLTAENGKGAENTNISKQ